MGLARSQTQGLGLGAVVVPVGALQGDGAALGEPATDRVRVHLVAQGGTAGQGVTRRVGILLDVVRVVPLGYPRQRVQGQAIAHGRISGDQIHPFVPEEPGAGRPDRAADPLVGTFAVGRQRPEAGGLQGQHIADHAVESLAEHPAKPCALQLVTQFAVEGIHVHRQPAFAPEKVPGVFVARGDVLGAQAQAPRECLREPERILARVMGLLALIRQQGRVVPTRFTVGPPEDRQGPARQLFAGVPLALAHVHEPAGAIALAQTTEQLGGIAALGGTQCVGVPLRRIAVSGGDIRGFPTHGQPDIAAVKVAVDLIAQTQDGRPLVLGVGPCHAGRLVDARDLHLMAELDLARIHAAFHGGCTGGLRCACQRDVSFSGQQARGGIQTDPAGTGQEHLAPGVQVGEVGFRTAGAINGLDVGRELDQVPRDETRGQAQVAQQLHQKPA